MGIKNLNSIIKKHSINSIENIKLNKLFNKIISIDTSIYLYKYLYNETNYLYCFLKQIIKLLKNGIIPLYVFDGKPPEEKKELLTERKTKKQYIKMKIDLLDIINNNSKIDQSGNIKLNEDISNETLLKKIDKDKYELIDEKTRSDLYNNLLKMDFSVSSIKNEINKNKKKLIYVRKEHIDKLIELLEILGIPYLRGKHEAEIICAELNKKNIVNGCITEDSDYLTNGGNFLLKNFNSNTNSIVLYKLHEVLKDLNLSKSQFIDLCILCGCDYTSTIYGIGQVRALKLIKEHKSIEGIINYIKNNKTKFIIPESFDYKCARDIFNIKVYTDKELKNIKKNIILKEANIDKCLKFFKDLSVQLNNYYLRELNNINLLYKKINSYKKKKKQQKLTNYFSNMITKEI